MDARTEDAVLMRLLDIGESLNRVRQNFPEFRETHARDARRQAVGLRNVIAHDYGSGDLKVVWRVMTRDLTKLAESLQASIDANANRPESDQAQT